MQITRNELREIVTRAVDEAAVPEPDRSALIKGVEDADGVCFGAWKKKYSCPVTHMAGNANNAEEITEAVPELYAFMTRFDEAMAERFAESVSLFKSYNVDIVG